MLSAASSSFFLSFFFPLYPLYPPPSTPPIDDPPASPPLNERPPLSPSRKIDENLARYGRKYWCVACNCGFDKMKNWKTHSAGQ